MMGAGGLGKMQNSPIKSGNPKSDPMDDIREEEGESLAGLIA